MIAWHYLSWWAYAEIQREMLAAESLVRDRTSDVAEIASAAVFALAGSMVLSPHSEPNPIFRVPPLVSTRLTLKVKPMRSGSGGRRFLACGHGSNSRLA